MSIGVTYKHRARRIRIYPENRVEDLISSSAAPTSSSATTSSISIFTSSMGLSRRSICRRSCPRSTSCSMSRPCSAPVAARGGRAGHVWRRKDRGGPRRHPLVARGKSFGNRGVLLLRCEGYPHVHEHGVQAGELFYMDRFGRKHTSRGAVGQNRRRSRRMIQPLKSSKTSWTVFWIDLEEPLPSGGGDFMLPTLMIVMDERGCRGRARDARGTRPAARGGNLSRRLIDSAGAPDLILIGEADEWDQRRGRIFAEDYRVAIQFTRFQSPRPQGNPGAHAEVQRGARRRGERGGNRRRPAEHRAPRALRVQEIALLEKAIDNDASCSMARIELADAKFRSGDWTNSLRGLRRGHRPRNSR